MKYRCVVTSVEGFVQQLASAYLPNGYWFYVDGIVPVMKEPELIDRKLLNKYGINVSPATRSRRKASGLANLHYLRLGHRFLLLATHGRHDFFADEARSIRDVRRIPIRLGGYSISVKRGGFCPKIDAGRPPVRDGKWRVRVQIGREHYLAMKAYFVDIARQRSAEQLGRELYCVPFEPYAPVRQQMLNVLRLVNRARKQAGLQPVSPRVLRYRRRIVRPFDWPPVEEVA